MINKNKTELNSIVGLVDGCIIDNKILCNYCPITNNKPYVIFENRDHTHKITAKQINDTEYMVLRNYRIGELK